VVPNAIELVELAVLTALNSTVLTGGLLSISVSHYILGSIF